MIAFWVSPFEGATLPQLVALSRSTLRLTIDGAVVYDGPASKIPLVASNDGNVTRLGVRVDVSRPPEPFAIDIPSWGSTVTARSKIRADYWGDELPEVAGTAFIEFEENGGKTTLWTKIRRRM